MRQFLNMFAQLFMLTGKQKFAGSEAMGVSLNILNVQPTDVGRLKFSGRFLKEVQLENRSPVLTVPSGITTPSMSKRFSHPVNQYSMICTLQEGAMATFFI